ncbi:hypothetical protein WL29_23295 [Burkholderia ubonensis]|uniref:Receptor-recognising protein Gp38 domain-containing protein n=1 Tax=Burkholderia ubonensis TaxID=101571 RepID=A0A119HFP8_9BURK|nr:putative Ig domain-containing protein [Burkholderia ubonensis]KWA84285.1 hypothetical protein WL29_23295 [Burkholderia ubonensis]
MSLKNTFFHAAAAATALLLAAGSALATSSYYVVVPVKGRTVSNEAITVALSGFALPSGIVGIPYDGFNLKSLLSVTGDPAYTGYGVHWSLVSGSLPSGLTLNSDGTIAGTPTANGTSSFLVRATYKTKTGEQNYQIVVAAIAVGLAAGAPPEAIVGTPYIYDLKPLLSVTGDTTYTGAGVTWSTVSSSLPAGLYLTADGVIVGTPTAGGAGMLTARATYRNSKGEQAYQVVSLNIAVTLTAATLPNANVGTSYSYDFKPLLSVSGDPSYAIAAVQFNPAAGATLPAGLALSTAGVLSGTPSAVGSSSFSIVASYRGKDGTQQYTVSVQPAFFDFNPTISSSTTNYNLRTAAQAAGWDGVRPLRASVTINSGVYVGSPSTGSYAFDTGSGFPAGTTLKLTNSGTVVGQGGDGGSYGAGGGSGGPAMHIQYPITVANYGTIAGGGGGGAGSNRATITNVLAGGAGGGGGQGYGTSLGGARDPAFSGAQYPQGGAGYNGNMTTPGLGGTGVSSGAFPNQYSSPWYASSASGGAGGTLGQAGAASGPGWIAGGTAPPGLPGGVPGNAITGAANVTWTATGTILGPQN